MTDIHDSGYKRLFSNKEIFRQLMLTFVDQHWVRDLDFKRCETLDKSFVSEHYKATESDIIYKTKLKGRDIYIFILLEFQSTVQRFMSLRILNYITNFYMDYLNSNKGVKKLPAIFPILLYNGDRKWTAPTAISALIENNELLGKFSLNFEYFKVAENEYTKRQLIKIRNIVSTLFLAESHYDIDLLKHEFLNLFHSQQDKQAVSLFLNWFKQLSEHGKIDQSDYKSLEKVYTQEKEVQAMLIKALEKEKKEIYEKGMEKGMEQGMEKGLEKGLEKGTTNTKIDIAKSMLLNNEPIEKIRQYTGLSKAVILKLKAQL